MDFCFNCGTKTDPDWVFCRACGGALDEDEVDLASTPAPEADGAPKVELISRGWDVIEAVETPTDPLLDDEPSPTPLPPGAVEVSVDDITIVETEETPVDAEPAAEPATADPWDHLRPHGELPPLQRRVTLPGRAGQSLVLLAAFGALVAGGIHFYLNVRLDAFNDGNVTAGEINDLERIADISMLVVAGLVVVALLAVLWWLIRIRTTAELRPGKVGLIALLALVGAGAVVAISFLGKGETVSEAIGANSLVVLGLGLLMTACVAAFWAVQRIESKEPS